MIREPKKEILRARQTPPNSIFPTAFHHCNKGAPRKSEKYAPVLPAPAGFFTSFLAALLVFFQTMEFFLHFNRLTTPIYRVGRIPIHRVDRVPVHQSRLSPAESWPSLPFALDCLPLQLTRVPPCPPSPVFIRLSPRPTR